MRLRTERANHSCKRIPATVALLCGVLGLLSAQQASADMITLDAAAQGSGSKGLSYRPTDDEGLLASFVLTARSAIDEDDRFNPDAWGQAGTVCMHTHGAGVRNEAGSGSKAISGGGDQDEEVIVTYDAPVLAGSVQLGLYDLDFGHGLYHKDDPVLFVMLAGASTWSPAIMESELENAFTSTGHKRGIIDFALLSSVEADQGVTAFKFRETRGHDYINMVSTGTPVPEPATLALLAGGGLCLLRRRRRRRA